MNFTKRSWKTTSTGVLMVVGGLSAIILAYLNTGQLPENFTAILGTIIGGIGLIVARDNDKTSEDVDADVWSAEAKRQELRDLGTVRTVSGENDEQ